MVKSKVVSVAVDDEQYGRIIKAMIEYEKVSGNGRVSISKFMREMFLPLFNKDANPSIYDLIREHATTKNVSSKQEDTISPISNDKSPPSIPDSIPENVSTKQEDTFSDTDKLERFEFKFD